MPNVQMGAIDWGKKDTIQQVPLRLLTADPDNARKSGSKESYEALKASIQVDGIMEAVVVRPGKNGEAIIVSGHRRAAAADKLGLRSIPIRVRPDLTGDDPAKIVKARIDYNAHREDLTPVDKAQEYQNYIQARRQQHSTFDYKSAAKELEVTPATMARYLSLLTLPTNAKEAVSGGRITFEQAVYLAKMYEGGRRMTTKEVTKIIAYWIANPEKRFQLPNEERPSGRPSSGGRTRQRVFTSSEGVVVSISFPADLLDSSGKRFSQVVQRALGDAEREWRRGKGSDT